MKDNQFMLVLFKEKEEVNVNEELIYQVLETVGEIPKGCVATYKQIACLIGREKNSRLVGKILANASYYGHYPCHRVVNFQGRLVPGCLNKKNY